MSVWQTIFIYKGASQSRAEKAESLTITVRFFVLGLLGTQMFKYRQSSFLGLGAFHMLEPGKSPKVVSSPWIQEYL